MVAVDDIRFKGGNRIFEYAGERRFVFLKIRRGEITKLGTFIRHYIAHTYDLIGNGGLPKPYKHALALINAVEIIRFVALDAGDQKIIMAACRSFPQHGLQIYTTAG